MVCADWRPEYGSSPVAVRRPGRAKGEEGAELERGGMGRYCPQDCSPDPDDEKSDFNPHAVESDCLSYVYTSVDNRRREKAPEDECAKSGVKAFVR